MIRREYYAPPKMLTNLADFDESGDSICFKADAKNIERLKDLNIDKLWVVSTKEQHLTQIFSLCKPRFLSIYELKVNNLNILETLTETEVMVLRWNTKATKLWDIKLNINLKSLTIEDFSKLEDISVIEDAQGLEYFVIEGGMHNTIRLNTISPLSKLQNLLYLRLANLKLEDDSLKPIGNLKKLKELMLSNQFETKEYAWLAAKLPNTQCDSFKAYINLRNRLSGNDVMVTGRRKPFLNSEKDGGKLQKYEQEFTRLVKSSE
jgi:hypothetical protein